MFGSTCTECWNDNRYPCTGHGQATNSLDIRPGTQFLQPSIISTYSTLSNPETQYSIRYRSLRTYRVTWLVIPRRITDFKSRIFSGFMIEEILMKTSRFSEPQILAILRQAEGGVAVPDLCREHGMSTASFYKWRAKYGDMDASMISQMKALEDENRRLKKMYAEMSMQAELLKEALGKK